MSKLLKFNPLMGRHRFVLSILFVLILGASTMYAVAVKPDLPIITTGSPSKAAPGIIALSSTATGIARYVPAMQKLCYALAAIIAIVSAVVIYKKISDGAENAKKLIAMPVLACVFLTASATALPKFFGLDEESKYNGFTKLEELPFDPTLRKPLKAGARPGGATDTEPGMVENAGSVFYNKSDAVMVADDGTLFVIGPKFKENWDWKLGLNPESNRYEHYFVNEQGLKEWDGQSVAYANPRYSYLDHEADYQYYEIADDGNRLYGSNPMDMLNNPNVVFGVTADDNYSVYLPAEGGGFDRIPFPITQEQLEGSISYQNASGIAKAPDGTYRYYVAVTNSPTDTTPVEIIYGSEVDNILNTPFARIGKDESGNYKVYALADDGTKVWDEYGSKSLFPFTK